MKKIIATLLVLVGTSAMVFSATTADAIADVTAE
jgi:hypothetical protein